MDDRRVCNELFLQAVANQYTLDFKKLKMGVSDVFTREEKEDIDPDGDYLYSTEHFDCFVKEHEIKEVNVSTVVLYLKGVKLAVSHQETLDELEYEVKSKYFLNFALTAAGLAYTVFHFCFENINFSIKWPALR